MIRSLIVVLVLSFICIAQQPQPTPQEQITALVSRQAQLSADVIVILNQVPQLVKSNQDLQAQVKELQEKLNKKEGKK